LAQYWEGTSVLLNSHQHLKRQIPHLRWWIIGVCFLGTTVNYIDRQCLSVAAPTISKEFGFTNEDYASIVTSFLAAYTVMQFLSGQIVDRIGVRWGMAMFAAWWAAAGMLHSLCSGLWSFRAARFMLGMGEAGNWPAATKAVSEWFPARERGIAVAIFDSGSGLGGVVAAPLVAWLIVYYSWQVAFLATGALAILWLLLWLWIYHRPEEHDRITAAELKLVQADRPLEPKQDRKPLPWRSLLAYRQVWGIILGRFLTDGLWWFYVYWLPKYLADERGFTLADIAASAWIPFVSADLGNFGGGFLSGYLMRRGWNLNAARKAVLVLGALGMLAGVPAGLTSSTAVCLAMIAIATFSYGAWGTMMLTLPTDLLSSRNTASVSGMSGTGAGIGGMAFTWLVGVVTHHLSYTPIFLIAGLVPLGALVVVHKLIPEISAIEHQRANA
jgi:MFS transporter, ACS family, hexuronate transporter